MSGTARGRAKQNRAFFMFRFTILFRGVAQLVGRLLWEQDAAGSSPVTSTKLRGIDRKVGSS